MQNKKTMKQNRRRQSTRRFRLTDTQITVGIVVSVLVVLGGLVVYGVSNYSKTQATIEGVESFRFVETKHQQGLIAYEQKSPAGGTHNAAWQNCGVYDQSIQNETAVHSLEHGVVWITYRPDLPTAEVERLQTVTRQSPRRLLSPYPDLPAPIMVSSWGYQLKLNRSDDPRLLQFINKYENSASAPEPGASCAGGVGQPKS